MLNIENLQFHGMCEYCLYVFVSYIEPSVHITNIVRGEEKLYKKIKGSDEKR